MSRDEPPLMLENLTPEILDSQDSEGQSQLISKILGPAVQFWLRSQADKVEALQVKIHGRNRQILTGYLPKVSLSAQGAVYQGLHLSEVELTAENIRINLGQVLKGKPLRLLQPVPVTGHVRLEQSDLQASLDAPLLASALQDLFLSPGSLVNPSQQNPQSTNVSTDLPSGQIRWQTAEITPEEITIRGEWLQGKPMNPSVLLQTGLKILDGQILHLSPLTLQGDLAQNPPRELQIPLGSEVNLTTLSLTSGQLAVQGEILVSP
ncbi:DUF2993 domain-containing protein [Spirulina subsalsa FACHB-351]|uniref:DUF2993 domain-containing protein n=1 Tax=Spirulina subsalsa FACHB-351 TaxID=234711 RepID=A0ABT3L7N2_9CYAN|nr:DUF2993 domain-containing protein [Spirulina subsalsa]MCW6037526.1 DUF2993 domain-containing protein [Spirulina subsalsa FACHB-351]